MTRARIAHLLTAVAALGFFVAAGLHISGYRAVVAEAQQGYSTLTATIAALWLAFGAALAVFGAIVTLVALGRVREGRWILTGAGCFPFITVLLQLRLIGFIGPVAILSTVAVLCFLAALATPPRVEAAS